MSSPNTLTVDSLEEFEAELGPTDTDTPASLSDSAGQTYFEALSADVDRAHRGDTDHAAVYAAGTAAVGLALYRD